MMEKKSVAVTIFSVLVVVFIISIGATLSAFKVEKEKVEVKGITLSASNGILIADEDGNEIFELEVKSSSIGVRPATGEEDCETCIPTTVNDAVGTEGAYSSFKLSASGNWEIVLKSCSLTAGEDENLKNVRVAIMEEKNEPVNGSSLGAVLARGGAVENKEMVVVVWLEKSTTKSIKSADIYIELEAIIK